MTWVRIDDHFDEHPKIARLDDHALALFVSGLAYCNRNLTDGFIPNAVGLGQLRWCEGNTLPSIRDLEAVGLWEQVEGGWQVHDYDQYQPSREDVLREREANRERKARSRSRSRPESQRDTVRTPEPVTPLPVPVPVTPVSQDLKPSSNEEAKNPLRYRKPSKSEEIAHDWLRKIKPQVASGEFALIESYEAALMGSWDEAARADDADPATAGRMVLGEFLEKTLERKPDHREWGLLTKLAKGYGLGSIHGLDAALSHVPDDWYRYAVGTCKKRLEEELARAP